MDGKLKVRFAGPVKFGAKWYAAGDEAEVTPAEKAELVIAGVIESDRQPDAAPAVQETASGTDAAWDAAVAAGAEVLAEAMVSERIAAVAESLVAERDAALSAAQAAGAERDALRGRILELEIELTAASQPVTLPDPESGADGKGDTAVPDPAPKPTKARAPKG